MDKNNFKSIYIIGTGSLPLHILKVISSYNKENNVELEIIPISYHEILNSTYERYCLKNNSNYKKFDDKNELRDFLIQIDEKALIISANNYFIFTEDIVNKNNLEIINFHNSLLPKHRGLNAALWTLIERDEYTGITWHKVDSMVDKGKIIYQEKYKIKDDETFFSLTKILLEMGILFIKKHFSELLNYNYNKCNPISDSLEFIGGGSEYHYMNKFPNDGYLDTDASIEDISLYLRTFDDNHLNIIPKLKVIIDSHTYEIIGYSNNNEQDFFNEDFDLEYIVKTFKLYLKKLI